MIKTSVIQRKFWVADLLMPLAGVVLILFITSKGPGVTPDSVNYIDAAQNLSSGNGLKVLMPNGNTEPMTHFPPLFPMILALFHLVKVDPVSAARWMNAVLFGANIFVAGLMVKKSYGSSFAAFTASAFILCSTGLIYVHSMIWSEPLFILLAMGGLFFLSKFPGSRRSRDLVCPAICFALAVLCRYAGMSLIPTGLLVFLFIQYDSNAQRVRDMILFLCVSLAPAIFWMFRNAFLAGNATDRQWAFHPIVLHDLKVDFYSLSHWILSSAIPGWLGTALLVVISFGVVLLSLLFAQHEKMENEARFLSLVLAVFILVYIAFIIVSTTFLAAHIPFDTRIFSPVVFALSVLLTGLVFRQLVHRVRAAAFVIVVALIFCVYHAWGGAQEIKKYWMGYASDSWRQSELINAVKMLPPNIPIYTNGPEAVLFLTGKRSRRVPEKIHPSTWQPNNHYHEDMNTLKQQLGINGAYLVYFRAFRQWRIYLPSEEVLKRELNLQVVSEARDGAVYRGRL